MLMVVVLPAPLGPSRPVTEPSTATKSTPRERLEGAEALLETDDLDTGTGHGGRSYSDAAPVLTSQAPPVGITRA